MADEANALFRDERRDPKCTEFLTSEHRLPWHFHPDDKNYLLQMFLTLCEN